MTRVGDMTNALCVIMTKPNRPAVVAVVLLNGQCVVVAGSTKPPRGAQACVNATILPLMRALGLKEETYFKVDGVRIVSRSQLRALIDQSTQKRCIAPERFVRQIHRVLGPRIDEILKEAGIDPSSRQVVDPKNLPLLMGSDGDEAEE